MCRGVKASFEFSLWSPLLKGRTQSLTFVSCLVPYDITFSPHLCRCSRMFRRMTLCFHAGNGSSGSRPYVPGFGFLVRWGTFWNEFLRSGTLATLSGTSERFDFGSHRSRLPWTYVSQAIMQHFDLRTDGEIWWILEHMDLLCSHMKTWSFVGHHNFNGLDVNSSSIGARR